MCGDTHAWLASYLQGRTSVVRVKKEVSESSVSRTGVPQVSVLGPILFNVYIASREKLLQQHGIQHHMYANDTQLYVDFPPTKHADALARVEACVRDVNTWLCDNSLILNGTKSQVIVIRSPSLCAPITITRIDICGQLVATSAVVRDLGFAVDADSLDGGTSSKCMPECELPPVPNFTRT